MLERAFFFMRRFYADPGAVLFAAMLLAGLFAFARAAWGVSATGMLNIPIVNNPPSVSGVLLNNGNPITLTPNATTTVNVNFTVTDTNGCADVFTNGGVTSTVFRSGTGESCGANGLNCYITVAVTHGCSGGNNSANATATVEIYYFAQATDASSSFPSENWQARVSVRDASSTSHSATSTGVELNTLLAISLPTSTLNYGNIPKGGNTGSSTLPLGVKNAGNSSTSLQISGTALTSGSNSIPTSSQHYATSTFTFGGAEQMLSSIASAVSGFLISGPPLADWSNTTALPNVIQEHAALAYNGYLYVLGGLGSGPTPTSTVWMSSPNSNGSVSSWSRITPLPEIRRSHRAALHKGTLYIAGGIDQIGVVTESVFYAQPGSTGTFSSWNTATSLPVPLWGGTLIAEKDHLYWIGGNDDSGLQTSTVISAPIQADGSLGTWSNTTPLPGVLQEAAAVGYEDWIYVFGGADALFTATSTVFRGAVNSSGTIDAWTRLNPLPARLQQFAAGLDGDLVYLAGGRDSGGSDTSTVMFAALGTDGSLSNWSPVQPLPSAVRFNAGALHNGYFYSIGGQSPSATSTVRFAPLASRNTYWGAEVPPGQAAGNYSGTVNLTAVFSP